MSRKTNSLCLALIATWSLALASRYYAADYVSGSDGNLGYSDSSMTAAGTVAVKTLTRLRQIIPDLGDGRAIVIAVKGNTDGTDLQYLKPDGVTLDNLDLRGIYGYRYALVRTTRTFTNDATDKALLAPAIGLAGPNGDSTWTVAAAPAPTTTIFSVAAGTLTAEPGLNGMRVRFITGALAGQQFMLQRNTASQITSSRAFSAAPVAGATFIIERPGVSVDNIFINSPVGAAGGIGSGLVVPLYVVGFRARQTTLLQTFIGSLSMPFSLSFMEFDRCLSMRSVSQVNFARTYIDESGTAITTGCGLRWAQNSAVIVLITDVNQLLNIQDSALLSLGANSSIARTASLLFGVGCYFNTNGFTLSFVSSGFTRLPAGQGIGSASASATAIMVLVGRLVLSSSQIPCNGIDLNSAGANPCITILDPTGNSAAYISNLISSGGGNTDVVVDYTGLVTCQVRVVGTLTATATLGDVRVAGPAIQTFAALAAGVTDANGNVSRA